MSHVVLFAYQTNLNISRKKRIRKILPKKLYCHQDKFWCHRHFKRASKSAVLIRIGSESNILLPFLRSECIAVTDQNALHALYMV